MDRKAEDSRGKARLVKTTLPQVSDRGGIYRYRSSASRNPVLESPPGLGIILALGVSKIG